MTDLEVQIPTTDPTSEERLTGTKDSTPIRAGEQSAARPTLNRQIQSGTGRLRRKLTKAELINTIRLNLAAEQEVVHLYLAHADLTDDPLVEKVLRDIADEESAHIAEFARLLTELAPEEGALMTIRAQRVDALRCAPPAVRPVSGEPSALLRKRDMHGA
jgi:uncharacterized protein